MLNDTYNNRSKSYFEGLLDVDKSTNFAVYDKKGKKLYWTLKQFEYIYSSKIGPFLSNSDCFTFDDFGVLMKAYDYYEYDVNKEAI
jgi:hypothetical protein